jgi:hypothetical protein
MDMCENEQRENPKVSFEHGSESEILNMETEIKMGKRG